MDVAVLHIFPVTLFSHQIQNLPEYIRHACQLIRFHQWILYIDSDNNFRSHLPGNVYGIIIRQSAVHQYHAIEINRGEYSRNGHTGAHGSCQNTVVENDFAAIHDVIRYTGEWNRHPVERNGVVISHCQFGE